ncbi:hypothetical protein ABK040_013307 [Willaertia magna]
MSSSISNNNNNKLMLLVLCSIFAASFMLCIKADDAMTTTTTTTTTLQLAMPKVITLSPQSRESYKIHLSHQQTLNLFYIQFPKGGDYDYDYYGKGKGKEKSNNNNVAIHFESNETEGFKGEYKIPCGSIEEKTFECLQANGCSLKITLTSKSNSNSNSGNSSNNDETSVSTNNNNNNNNNYGNNNEDTTVILLPIDSESFKLYLAYAAGALGYSLLGVIVLALIVLILIIVIIVLAVKLRKTNKKLAQSVSLPTVIPLNDSVNNNNNEMPQMFAIPVNYPSFATRNGEYQQFDVNQKV